MRNPLLKELFPNKGLSSPSKLGLKHSLCFSRTPPHKTPTRVQNNNGILRFGYCLGSHRDLRISWHSWTCGWLESKSAFKPTLQSLWSWAHFNRPFRAFDPVAPVWAPQLTKHQQVSKTTTKSFVFIMVWVAIETLGFWDILERLAGLSPKVSLSQPFRVCEAQRV